MTSSQYLSLYSLILSFRKILAFLLDSNISCFTLLTGSTSTYVLQKLITALPSVHLGPLLSKVLESFIQLSMNVTGCRAVQLLLEFCSSDQQMEFISLLSQQRVLVDLVTNPFGTYVAQVKRNVLTNLLHFLYLYRLPYLS